MDTGINLNSVGGLCNYRNEKREGKEKKKVKSRERGNKVCACMYIIITGTAVEIINKRLMRDQTLKRDVINMHEFADRYIANSPPKFKLFVREQIFYHLFIIYLIHVRNEFDSRVKFDLISSNNA